MPLFGGDRRILADLGCGTEKTPRHSLASLLTASRLGKEGGLRMAMKSAAYTYEIFWHQGHQAADLTSPSTPFREQ